MSGSDIKVTLKLGARAERESECPFELLRSAIRCCCFRLASSFRQARGVQLHISRQRSAQSDRLIQGRSLSEAKQTSKNMGKAGKGGAQEQSEEEEEYEVERILGHRGKVSAHA